MMPDVPIVLAASRAVLDRATSVGGKAANLARLEDLGMPVPPWFVITTDAFERALAPGGLRTRIAERLGRIGSDEDLRRKRSVAGS